MANMTWGPWTLNTTNACLEYPLGIEPYQIPVDTLKDSARILDRIFSLNEKTWATPDVVGHFVEAVEAIFGRGVAGGGIDHEIDPTAALANNYGIVFPSQSRDE